MRQIDLNADLGELENATLDAAVMPFISSANIACGGHAGNAESIRRTIRLAMEHGVAIGAHPGYPDRKNLGRLSMNLAVDALCRQVCEQIERFVGIAEEEGAAVRHIKLHGALYNDLAFDYDRSLSLCKAIAAIDSGFRFIAFSNSATARAAEDAGLTAIHEVFADRTYTAEGNLTPRSQSGAVIHDESTSLAQVEMMVLQQKVPVEGDRLLPVQADSVCVHGDNPSAIRFVANLRDFFERQRIAIRPAGEHRFRFAHLGEDALLARLPSRICRSTHRAVRALHHAVSRENIKGIREFVPCYSELKIDYDPGVVCSEELRERIEALSVQLDPAALPPSREIEVPVCYDGEDLGIVARHNGLTEEEVISRHSAPAYLVYMLGFSPGFPYMGGLDPGLQAPRLKTPRVSVPAGAVGIAGNQTGIYPVESPGGWNIIGRTPLRLFDPSAQHPFLFEPGDEVRFVPAGGQAGGRPAVSSSGRDRARPSKTRTINIIEPGMHTSVQDAGRPGWLRYGLPPGGAMDRQALEAANALLGNEADCAVLECTGTLPVLEFNEAHHIAVVYADRVLTLGVSAGERIRLEPMGKGYRAYIAVAGGIDVPEVMGSRSTYLPAGLGGFEGRTLRAGDVLPVGNDRDHRTRLQPAVGGIDDSARVRVVPGPEAGWFDCGGLNTFLTESFTVSARSDRTGIRLEGPPLSFRSDEQMVSAGLAMGTIQVPPSGLPIIMMADHPATGGYPRIGCVVREDLPRIAQQRPGAALSFREV